MYQNYNPNPYKRRVGDCTVRAIAKLMDLTWRETFLCLAIYGYIYGDMPNGDDLWGKFLRDRGYRRYIITDEGYTVEDFCLDHPRGKYLLALKNHVIAVENGTYYDTFDHGEEEPIYYWKKRSDEECTETDTE